MNDGGHFELSPMYHAIFLEDLLDVLNIHKAYNRRLPQDLENQIKYMLFWLDAMTHPDGDIAFFNDSVTGISSTFDELKKYANTLKILYKSEQEHFIHLKDTGYIVINNNDYYGILDIGHIGPDYIPGHGHADILSFEISIFQQRVFVNSGISCYGISDERLRQRETLAHNTVQINGESSSEVWSGFRVARRAKPQNLSINQSDSNIKIKCSHDADNS